MLDVVEITVVGGTGGDGCVSFRRERYVPRGGPDGGDGGNGGDVWLVADASLATLASYAYGKVYRGEDGEHGRGKTQRGKDGTPLVLPVPVGTVVFRQVQGRWRQEADLAVPGARYLAAYGGRGGRGNRWWVSPTNQEPLLAEAGEPGEQVRLRLEVKLLADVGIIGKPNAGKSTLIARVSHARPKIAPYPFTTLQPVLGAVSWKGREFIAMEVPGLIRGAHAGAGLGTEFLRHAERARLLVHLVDGSGSDPLQDWQEVEEEVRLYGKGLADKPRLVAVNKMDLPEAQAQKEKIALAFAQVGHTPLFLSAATGEGVDALLDRLVADLERLPPPVPPAGEPPPVFQRPRPRERRRIVREGSVWRLEWERAERIASLLVKQKRLSWKEKAQLRVELERMGAGQALAHAGVQPGDTVLVDGLELEW
ncbi:MAG: GTPase ObgE [Dehalococcoidia bacterium]|nr:GTPase ObgE [Dehalococcoidia bacterium]MDW8120623.1 GTPase ObgE [Chloroflexota bacterium]